MTHAPTPVTPPGAQLPTPMLEDLLVQHLPDVHRAIRSLARRYRLPHQEEADLLGDVLVRLVADDYAVLRKYRHQSAPHTYLRVVAYRVLLDTRIRQWGKWRPSSRALAHGASAVRFERMVAREGLTAHEALREMSERGERLDPEVAASIGARIARRSRARVRPPQHPGEASVDAAQDRVLESRDLARYASHAGAVIRQALEDLSDEDLELLRRRFVKGEPVAELARTSGMNQKRLYCRHARILRRVGRALAAANLVSSDLLKLVGHPDVQVPDVFGASLSA